MALGQARDMRKVVDLRGTGWEARGMTEERGTRAHAGVLDAPCTKRPGDGGNRARNKPERQFERKKRTTGPCNKYCK